jgi:hypothetical protein
VAGTGWLPFVLHAVSAPATSEMRVSGTTAGTEAEEDIAA